jgi:hypothetical protein
MFRAFAEWLATTHVSKEFSEHTWVIPTSQSIHIVAVSAVFASACMINLRLLGIGARGRRVSELSRTLLPWMWTGLGVLVATGLVQTIAEPVRQFVTPVYWAKMTMIVIVAVLTAFYARGLRRHASTWDESPTRPVSAKAFAVVSTVLWLGIVACGRFIAYTWSFYV